MLLQYLALLQALLPQNKPGRIRDIFHSSKSRLTVGKLMVSHAYLELADFVNISKKKKKSKRNYAPKHGALIYTPWKDSFTLKSFLLSSNVYLSLQSLDF